MPALFTSTSMPPNFFSAALMAAAIWPWFVTSSLSTKASPLAAKASTSSGLRAVTTVRKPRSSAWVASSRPKPVEQPVINQTGVSVFVDFLFFMVIVIIFPKGSWKSRSCGRVKGTHAHQLFVHELLDAHARKFASIAGVLDAAERQVRGRPGRVVDEHHARVNAAGHAFAARNIPGEDRSPQPEIRVIGEGHRLILIFDPEEERDRPEEFLSEGGIAGFDIRQDRRLHERAWAINAFAAHHNGGALGDSLFDLVQQFYQGRFGGQGSERRRLVHRISWLESRQRGLELVEKAVGQFFDDDETLRGNAALAHVVHFAPDRPLDRLVEVGVLEHNEGVAAAQLHRGLLKILSGSRGNAFPGFNAARQRHALDPGIINHAVHLVMRDQEVGIGARWRTRLTPQLL